ncbi:26S proteasome non-ATPase regulatory subunit 3 homolog B-like isoform X2 [Tasmannia lanceolata]|uniref:26S proteasome non-ATPase regulatory subunit 3 homolog B-like isoform X2 n=1 Tax=Tasmannia lanceolata TaxID=3420 RepID=UPI0040643185
MKNKEKVVVEAKKVRFCIMTQDVEMKELQSPSIPVPSSILQNLKEIASLIETGAYTKEVRRILCAIRLTIALRRNLKTSVISVFLNFALAPGSEAHSRLSSYLPKVWKPLDLTTQFTNIQSESIRF